jgi:hypothetical protein
MRKMKLYCKGMPVDYHTAWINNNTFMLNKHEFSVGHVPIDVKTKLQMWVSDNELCVVDTASFSEMGFSVWYLFLTDRTKKFGVLLSLDTGADVRKWVRADISEWNLTNQM